MGFLDKLKNALFEEEYVEVEEKPKKVKKEIERHKSTIDEIDEKPIAKKILLPKKETSNVDIDEDDLIDEDFEIKPKNSFDDEPKKDFKIMDDEDFKVDSDNTSNVEPKIVRVIDNDKDEKITNSKYFVSEKKEREPYSGSSEFNINHNSDNSIKTSSSVSLYNEPYAKRDDRTHFKPSPIISPIYGILDKNYHKEDVVMKKEVRLSSSYCNERVSVEDVRKKAYGTVDDNDKINDTKVDNCFEVEELSEEENSSSNLDEKDLNEDILVDLSSESKKPLVSGVTVGDAVEYFEDLGLEYNVDYMDASKKRRSDRYENISITNEKVDSDINKNYVVEDEKSNDDLNDDGSTDDNLFDLIDSMYKDEE